MLMPSIFNDDLFDDVINDFAVPSFVNNGYRRTSADLLRTDIKEADDGYTLEMELPGFSKDNVKASLKDGYLTINASTENNNDEKDDKNEKYICKERYYGKCSRSFYVGNDVTENDIKAKFKDGVLSIFIPKKEAKPEVEDKNYIAIEG